LYNAVKSVVLANRSNERRLQIIYFIRGGNQ